MFFTAYIDDSGSDPNQLIANATAFIVPAAKIIRFQTEWGRLREKYRFSYFHTSVFVARDSHSEFADWDDTRQEQVFNRVRRICKKYGVKAISMTVHKKDYDEIVPEDFRRFSGIFHYTWALRHVLKHVAQWRLTVGIHAPLAYVFDSMGKDKKKNLPLQELKDLMDQAQKDAAEKGLLGEYDNWSMGSSREVPGLQCADLVAWTTYQYGLLAFRQRPLIEEAKIVWADFTHPQPNGEWLFAVTVTRENLKKWIDMEMADGTSMKKFKLWEEKKLAEGNSHVTTGAR